MCQWESDYSELGRASHKHTLQTSRDEGVDRDAPHLAHVLVSAVKEDGQIVVADALEQPGFRIAATFGEHLDLAADEA